MEERASETRGVMGDLTGEQRNWLWGLLALASVITLPLGYLALRGMVNESRLARSTTTTCAEIVQRHTAARGRRRQFEVRYAFEVGGQRYTHGDETGRDELWADVPEGDWQRSRETGCVDVVYLADDPSVNRPQRSTWVNDPMGNKIAALFLCALTLLLCGAGARGILKVANARLYTLDATEADRWWLLSAEGERALLLSDVARALLIQLPRARLHPPWRFDTDILCVRLLSGEEIMIEAPPGARTDAALAWLETHRPLRRKRAS